jgi:hypothetical protein
VDAVAMQTVFSVSFSLLKGRNVPQIRGKMLIIIKRDSLVRIVVASEIHADANFNCEEEAKNGLTHFTGYRRHHRHLCVNHSKLARDLYTFVERCYLKQKHVFHLTIVGNFSIVFLC